MLSGHYITYRRPATALTVADIFREYWAEYKQQYPVTPQQAKVVGSVLACRTPALGGRLDQCQECGAWVFRFNSCRDRHCNQCQKYERARWVAKQTVMQLPISYFHIVFTVDHALNPLIRANQWAFYNLLFQTVQDVLQGFAKEKLGCEVGITAVLHTWGQKLDEHVHIHCIVTGGGLTLDGRRWVRPKNKRYLFDVVALSAAYRDKLLAGLAALHRAKKLVLRGEAAKLEVETVLAEARGKKWEVFIKPFADPQAVTEYLSRYVHQVAISNYRLLKLEGGRITFEYYENKERVEVGGKGKLKRLTLPVEAFIRRWLSHILPRGYKRIRYYGLHHSSARAEKLLRCRKLLGLAPELPAVEVPSLAEWLAEILGDEVDTCPHCGAKGSLIERTTFEQLPWLVSLILSLFGQPTTMGVCR